MYAMLGYHTAGIVIGWCDNQNIATGHSLEYIEMLLIVAAFSVVLVTIQCLKENLFIKSTMILRLFSVYSTLYFDEIRNKLFITFNYQLTFLEMKPEVKDRIMSHEKPVVAAIYNHVYNQVS